MKHIVTVFDRTFSDQISFISKSCYIRQLRFICPYLNSTTACIIVISVFHSEPGYGNSLYYNLSKCKRTQLQQIQKISNLLHVWLLKLL